MRCVNTAPSNTFAPYMIIVVNTRFLIRDKLEGYGFFLFETLRRITQGHPMHRFIFVFDRPFDPQFIFSNNIECVVAGPPARHPLLWKVWYDWKLPNILKKYKADLFLSMDGFCSLRTQVPQCLVIHDLAFRHYPAFNKTSHRWFYRRYTGRFIRKAKMIATVSEFSKKDIIDLYPAAHDRVDVIYSGVREIFRPITGDEKELIKSKYANGKEFFLYTGAIHPRKNLVGLLKAFSLFKKRQQSGMKLVLAGRLAWKNDAFLGLLQTYKYRDDVIMTGYLEDEELARLTGSAYAMVYPSFFEGFGVPVLEGMRAGIPVITSSGTAMEEIAQGAAILADPANHTAIAEQMMRIFKDETLRNNLIERGKRVATNYNWDKTAELLWKTIMKANA
jgi:glycosyltransferase involved in cell wall biosynthesis